MTREEKAEGLFRSGMNCSQAVVVAFTEDFGLDPALTAKMA